MKPKYIKTPEAMYELFEDYKMSLKPREIQKATATGVKSEFHLPPLTMSGFRTFGYKKGVTIHHYFSNSENAYNEYRSICKHIEEEIRTDQIEGGMVGQFNASITQRLNNLTERTDVTTQGQQVNDIKITIVSKDEAS